MNRALEAALRAPAARPTPWRAWWQAEARIAAADTPPGSGSSWTTTASCSQCRDTPQDDLERVVELSVHIGPVPLGDLGQGREALGQCRAHPGRRRGDGRR